MLFSINFKKTDKNVDVSLINPFIEATLNVLQTTSSVDGRTLAPYVKQDATSLGPVTGRIHLTGDPEGSVGITFSEDCILKAVSTMFGETITVINEEITDAVGEIGNMICGQVTNALAQSGVERKARMRDVLSGPSHIVSHFEGQQVVAVPFETQAGAFYIEICFAG